MRKVYNYMRL